jgi:3-methyladenine DNA glycosylase AlkD
MRSPYIAPKKLALEMRKRLESLANPERAAGAQRYFKEKVLFLGISTPEMRDLAREANRKIRPGWGVEEATEFCSIMLANPYHEVKGIGIIVFESFRKDFPKSTFTIIKDWLLADYCNSWALVDVLCPTSMATLLEKYPDLVKEIKGWTKSPNRWVRRASIVSFIKLAKKTEYLDAIYEIVQAHFKDKDDLIQKASGWLLREAGKSDAARLEKFLRRHGPAVPRTTLRYAIERFPEAERKALLQSTRPSRKTHLS